MKTNFVDEIELDGLGMMLAAFVFQEATQLLAKVA